MNKLISKNPILRFKLGLKIIKAQNGWLSRLGNAILNTDLAYIDNPSVMTAAGHTSKISEAHKPTRQERLLGSNLTKIGEAAISGLANQVVAMDNAITATRALPATVNRALPATVNRALPATVNRALPATVNTSRTATAANAALRTNKANRYALGTALALYPAMAGSKLNKGKNNAATGVSIGGAVGNAITNNPTRPRETLYSGTVWNYLNSKANGNWITNNKGNKYFTVTNDDGTKVNVFGNGLMYNQLGKLIGTITELEVRNALNRNQANRRTQASRRNQTNRNAESTTNVSTNTQVANNTSATPTLSNTYVGYATPETSKVQNVNLNWTYDGDTKGVGFVPTQSPAQKLGEGPSFYGEGLTDFNRGSIRGFRNQDGGFRNVDEYYNWLNNNQDSDLYKLWNNVLEGMDEETRRNTFNQIMNLFGISGNLGRRDSGRLAEVLNILRDLGVNGSTNLTAFMNSYRTALNNELAEGRRNTSPITSYTEQFRNLILNSKPSLATPPFIAIPRYDENGRPLAYSYKQGGLISKNPVELFKTNFRKGAL